MFGTADRRTVIVLLSKGPGVFVSAKSIGGKFDGLAIERDTFEFIDYLNQMDEGNSE